MTPFDTPRKQAFGKHCGKRRNCSLRAISPFPTVFSTGLNNFLPFSSNFKLSSAKSFNLEESKLVGWLYWGLTPLQQLSSYHGGR